MQLKDNQVITIKRVEDGYVIQKFLPDGEEQVEVIEESGEISEEEKVSIIALLYKVADWYGFGYDKWSNTNLNITFDKKGHKAMIEAEEEVRVDSTIDMKNEGD